MGIFLGYIDTPHNYQVCLPTNKMTMVHTDVKFYEKKAMRYSLERELQVHAVEDILAAKEERQDDVEQPHAEEKREETSTHVDSSSDGREHTREVDRLLHDAREKVGATTSHHR